MQDHKIQNAIALSGDFHTHARYQDFYETFGAQLNGFTGVYDYIADMADILTAYEAQFLDASGHVTLWEDYDWIEAIEGLVEFSIGESLKQGLPVGRKEIAAHLKKITT